MAKEAAGSGYRRYNPENFRPDNLFHPPTSPTHSELKFLVGQVAGALESRGSRRLLVGTEFEVLFFSPDVDPERAEKVWGRRSRDNPNRSLTHMSKIDVIRGLAVDLANKRSSEFIAPGFVGGLGLEFRTAPQNADSHLETIAKFGELLRHKCKELDVLPVVHSQHIHMSLQSVPIKRWPWSRSPDPKNFVPNGQTVECAFSAVNPLVLLPEEWDREYTSPFYLKGNAARIDGRIVRLEHPEFRKLSSEYANDPLLNLLLSLKAMYSGCSGQNGATSRITADTYEYAIVRMRNDTGLKDFFGQSTLSRLSDIADQYPAVSRREIAVGQIK